MRKLIRLPGRTLHARPSLSNFRCGGPELIVAVPPAGTDANTAYVDARTPITTALPLRVVACVSEASALVEPAAWPGSPRCAEGPALTTPLPGARENMELAIKLVPTAKISPGRIPARSVQFPHISPMFGFRKTFRHWRFLKFLSHGISRTMCSRFGGGVGSPGMARSGSQKAAGESKLSDGSGSGTGERARAAF
jgi:hypothetical protein